MGINRLQTVAPRRLLPVLLATTSLIVLFISRDHLAGQKRPSAEDRLRPATAVEVPESTGSIRLEFGLAVQEPRQWEGRIESSAGEVLSTWGWHFKSMDTDRIIGKSGWSLKVALHRDPAFRYQPTEIPSKVMPNGVTCVINAPDHAEFAVKTNHGNFSFRLADLKAVGRLTFLGEDVAAAYFPAIRPLTRGDASHHDFPSVTAVGDRVLVAWTTNHNEQSFVYAAQRDQDGGEWTLHKVAESWGDYYGAAVAQDGSDKAVVVWSEHKDDHWRLVSRSLDLKARRPGTATYVAPGGRRQLLQRITTDARGTPWLVWQEFTNGNFDIFLSSYSDGNWSAPIKVSESRTNDWNPAIAAAPDGTLYLAWDSYDRGNYDVFLRSLHGGRLGPVVPVTRGETYDAYPSLAVDPKNRVWLAWEEAEPKWGKDYGVLDKTGNRLHTSRHIRLACYHDGRFDEPVEPMENAVPLWMKSMLEQPQVIIGGNGLPYIFFRHEVPPLLLADQTVESRIGSSSLINNPWHDVLKHMSTINIIGFDGAKWLPARELPESEGRCHMQSGLALLQNKVFFVWPKDGRTYAEPRATSSQLQYAAFELMDRPATARRMKPFASEPTPPAEVYQTEQRDLERIHAVRWEDRIPLRLFRGDLHRHTDISLDGAYDGDIFDTYRYAIDVAALDFLAVTDHSFHERCNYYQYDWWRTRQIATMFNTPGHFIALFGYERTVSYPGGHRNIISTRKDAKPFRISDEEYTGVELYSDRLFPFLRSTGDIAIPHTTATNGGTDWRGANDSKAQPLVEIFQGNRGSYEEPAGPGKANINNPDGLVWNAWRKGVRVGVIASSDHVSTHESYACVYAPEFTARAIHDALKERRTYGATDNIVIKFQAVSASGQSYKMGREFSAVSSPALEVDIQGTDVLSRVDLIGDGQILLSRSPQKADHKFTYKDSRLLRGTAYYYVRVVQTNKQIAWSSPIWVDFQ